MEEIVEIISRIGIEGARWIEENVDEQFKALEFLWRRLKNPEEFVKLVTLNALVSYQLSGTGEEWWWEFAREVSSLEGYIEFLKGSKYNKRLLPAKEKRAMRFIRWVKNVDLLPYYTRMVELWKDIAKTMGSPPSAKTIVFSVKMYGYAARIVTERFVPYPMEIPIPVDSRIRVFTECLGEKNPLRFWSEVGRRSGVPSLHIDSILWPLLGGKGEEEIIERFGEVGRRLVDLTSSCRHRR